MFTRNLNQMFPEAPACKTYKGADARIAKLEEALEAASVERSAYLTSVVQREDGKFIAVCVVGPRSGWLAGMIARMNVCVANV